MLTTTGWPKVVAHLRLPQNVRWDFPHYAEVASQRGAQKPTATNPDRQSDENELVSLTHEWIDAINAKDQSELDKLMAPSFVLRACDGSWQAERERWLYNLFHVIDIQAYSHSAIRAEVFGDVAAVTSNWYWRRVRGTAGTKKPFEEHGYVLDMWQRTGGR